ncbi:Holliday junction branch migration protein RuvA [Silvanigrella paludirubra]|jgi:Holliday junction DNA helicase RuvA|uniref:Holliday junction branch migration complex subunit RuvA n=1 Tax=Silvanigrella paludirubra TaxID=2499159 RepID=A0A6N6VZH1_9BACT|nr:Holliday junction branch migration protein RuvA [Silvanigrella paludirubra]KAB8040676.1 Holliday junction branch migration protein RuvA [Silvanigrella paludirubra]
MIGFLRGILIEKNPENIVIDVGGVGYEIEVPATTLCQLPTLLNEVQLSILTHVREDAIRLFGFSSSFDKKVFQELIQVSGVGPKAALALLGPVDGYDLCEIITTAQITKLTSIPGVGPKTAERLVLELKDKLQKKLARKRDDIEIQKTKISENMAGSILNSNKASQKIEQKLIRKQIVEDLKSALFHLGYKDKQYFEVVNSVEQRLQHGENISFELALKESLSKLSERMILKH